MFGRLVVLGDAGVSDNGDYLVKAACTCGETVIVRGVSLRSGVTQSCGCLGRERRLAGVTKHGLSTNGQWHPLYGTWLQMKQRCTNPKVKCYHRYGGRGIRVCPEWMASFPTYLAAVEALGPRPSPEHTIDRKDNDGDYEPGNIRWATKKEQRANRSR